MREMHINIGRKAIGIYTEISGTNLLVSVTDHNDMNFFAYAQDEINLIDEGIAGAIFRIMDMVNGFGVYPDDNDFLVMRKKLFPLVW